MESLLLLEARFKSRFESYKLMKGRSHEAKAWKRAWLDVAKEIKKINKGGVK